MLGAAFALVSLGVVLGLGLVSLAMVGNEKLSRRAVPVAHVHGAVGLLGVAAVLLALRGPARGTHSGAGSFGVLAAALLAGALLAGSLILAAHLRRRPVSALAIGLHATLGVAGFVILAAFYGGRAGLTSSDSGRGASNGRALAALGLAVPQCRFLRPAR